MPDSSDESGPDDGVGLVQNDASDSESESSGSDSGSENANVNANGTGFLDVEASESGDSDSDDSSDSDSDDESILGEGRRRGPRAFFPEFRKLPIELRHRIWQFFCPDLAPLPRVLSFQMVCSPKQDSIWESATLENQIAAASAMLAVHRESRELALKAFPDTLAIREGRRLVRFHKQRDVVHLNGQKKTWEHNISVPGFSENVVNVALDTSELDPRQMRLFLAFPDLKNVFDFAWHNDRRIPHRLRWCASDRVHRYELEQLQKNGHSGEDLHFVYCWPDVDNHREFAEKHAGLAEVYEAAMTEIAEIREEDPDFMDDEDVARLGEIDYWQLTCFGWDAADRFEAWLAKHGVVDGDMPAPAADGSDDSDDKDGSEGSHESDDSSDQNEYESDGIDDATIDGESGDEEEDDDDLLIDQRRESDDEDDGGASEFGGFSPPRDEDGGMLIDGSPPAAHFSSPEPVSGEDRSQTGRRRARQAASSSGEESGEEEAGDSRRGASRRGPIILSDDEDEEEVEERPSQSTSRRGRVVLSDDDEDDGEETQGAKTARPAGRRARVLPSDDEDEDEDEGGADVGNAEIPNGPGDFDDDDDDNEVGTNKKPLSLAEKLARNRRENPVSDAEEESEEESSEEEPAAAAPPKKMSLAQQLMTHRKRNPVVSESEGESEGTVVDEDEDEDEEDEDEEDDENGMFMNMAEEGEDDDEGDEDDY
ncbi:hypothetical protein CTA2_1091 [Colletotrichum tanaceti]|uniref:2EXR domain-containing protein n=1 Tax=Colletotrichum tanaceti TaxID=1306861 RepID=A0A4U6X4C8_9PEZI|nr:hypothetical protein CTA2_1091 [Colletotrichum tanaceti]TKW50230.1 hypothetical protein CTA1_10185 [Colletotrichum tanaceti]